MRKRGKGWKEGCKKGKEGGEREEGGKEPTKRNFSNQVVPKIKRNDTT
jgi:hypothetical protein